MSAKPKMCKCWCDECENARMVEMNHCAACIHGIECDYVKNPAIAKQETKEIPVNQDMGKEELTLDIEEKYARMTLTLAVACVILFCILLKSNDNLARQLAEKEEELTQQNKEMKVVTVIMDQRVAMNNDIMRACRALEEQCKPMHGHKHDLFTTTKQGPFTLLDTYRVLPDIPYLVVDKNLTLTCSSFCTHLHGQTMHSVNATLGMFPFKFFTILDPSLELQGHSYYLFYPIQLALFTLGVLALGIVCGGVATECRTHSYIWHWKKTD